ncbi:VOC family protein [Aminobacter sp. MSH1]|uniref:VOC family protein n=1 Tax=Aminobacter sp. MSH1 TaxID=374606 RepID=UPI000D3BACE4|nr:VOC family protein [Aminobacter sp. MSH1]
MLSYIMVGADDIPTAEVFYSSFLLDLGYQFEKLKGKLFYTIPGTPDHNGPGSFIVVPPFDGKPATPGNGTMIAFRASNQAQVRAMHAQGLTGGGTDDGKPGFRADYGKHFYVGYLRDPQGNKVALFCTNRDEPSRDDSPDWRR